MRVEKRKFLNDDRSPRDMVLFICENEDESKVVDSLGKIGAKVKGEFCLADGYGEFYVRLEADRQRVNLRRLSVKQMLELTGVSRQTLYNWRTRYSLRRNDDKTFDLAVFLPWLVEFTKQNTKHQFKKNRKAR